MRAVIGEVGGKPARRPPVGLHIHVHLSPHGQRTAPVDGGLSPAGLPLRESALIRSFDLLPPRLMIYTDPVGDRLDTAAIRCPVA